MAEAVHENAVSMIMHEGWLASIWSVGSLACRCRIRRHEDKGWPKHIGIMKIRELACMISSVGGSRWVVSLQLGRRERKARARYDETTKRND